MPRTPKLQRQARVGNQRTDVIMADVVSRSPRANALKQEAKRKGVIEAKIVFKDTHLDEVPLIVNPVKGWDQLVDHMRDKKLPEFVIHPFGNTSGCPKNILNQFKKQVFRTASDGNGWIIHDGLSIMATLISDSMKLYKDSVRNPAVTIALVDYHRATSATAKVLELEATKGLNKITWPKWKLKCPKDQYESISTEQSAKPRKMVRFASQFIFYDPTIHEELIKYPVLRAREGAAGNTPIYIPSLRIMLRGSWKDTEELLKEWETMDIERPTIIVGDSGGLSEYIRDFLNDNSPDEERLEKYSSNDEMKSYKLFNDDILEENKTDDFQDKVKAALATFSRFYDEKKIFVWNVEEEQLSDILVTALHENDKETKTKVSQIALLNLALYLGCTDEANELYDSANFDNEILAAALMEALCLGKADFVQLSSDFHFDFTEFLTLDKLHQLYSQSVHRKRIIKIFDHFLGIKDPIPEITYTAHSYEKETKLHQFLTNLCDLERALLFTEGVSHRENSKTLAVDNDTYFKSEINYIPDPLKELLIWSVLTEETELTDIFLTHRTEYGVHDRLILARIYKRLSSIHEMTNHARAQEMMDLRNKYTEQAMAIMTICGQISETKASIMIRRACKEWSGFSALEIAYRTPNITFFDHVQVRRAEQLLWYGRVNERNSSYMALHIARIPVIGIFFYTIFYWMGWIEIHNNRAFRTDKENEEFYRMYDEKWHYSFIRFYRSPKSVFVTNLYLYIVLLLIFSWFLMFNYCDYPTKLEVLLLIWVLSMFIDEIRQFYTAPVKRNLRFERQMVARFWSWWCLSVWNQIDVFYQLLFISAFFVKNWTTIVSIDGYDIAVDQWTRQNFTSMECYHSGDKSIPESAQRVAFGHFMYCGALGLLFMRSTHFLAISAQLGPKLQMIRSMVADLRVFFWLMIIFLFSQGIILKSFENPNKPAPTTSWEVYELLYDVTFVPYFQIYGELFIEDFSNDEKTVISSLSHYKTLNGTDGPICGDGDCCFSGKSFRKTALEQLTGLEIDACYVHPKLSVLATVFYMVIANVIMLNILIAMFSHRYEAVQSRSKKVHSYMRYLLTYEYMDKPIIPPPLVIINPLLIMAKRIFVAIKHLSESDFSGTEVRRKKKLTNTIGLRPHKIHLLTLAEVHADRQSRIDRDVEVDLRFLDEQEPEVTEEGDYTRDYKKPKCPSLAPLCGKDLGWLIQTFVLLIIRLML